MKSQEFKNYLVEYLNNKSFEDVSIITTNEQGNDPVSFFIKYLNIADVEILVYGAYGSHSVLINLNSIEENEEVENIFNYMNHYETSSFEVIGGIDS